MKKSKTPSGRWIVRCDGLKVAKCDTPNEARDMADKLQQKTPCGMTMIFTVEQTPAPAN